VKVHTRNVSNLTSARDQKSKRNVPFRHIQKANGSDSTRQHISFTKADQKGTPSELMLIKCKRLNPFNP
jgi:hypothetical protein